MKTMQNLTSQQQQFGIPQQSNSNGGKHPQQDKNDQSPVMNGSDDDFDFEDTDECVIAKRDNNQQQQHNQHSNQNQPSGAQQDRNSTLSGQGMISPKFSTNNNMQSQGNNYNSKSTAKLLNMQNSVLIPSAVMNNKQANNDYDGQYDPEQYSQTFQQSHSQSQSSQQQIVIPNQHQIQQQQQQQQQQQYNSNQTQTGVSRGMVSSKSHKNFHSVVGNHSYNQLTGGRQNYNNGAAASGNHRSNNPHLTASINPQQQDTFSNATSNHQQQQQQLKNTFSTNNLNNGDDPEQDKDFNRAYLKLVKKMYQESGQNLLITQEELEKLTYQQQYLSLQDFNQRNQQCLENKQQKTKLLQEMKQQQEMQECTFKPQTYSQKQKRNFDQFLKDQAQYEEQKKKKNRDRQQLNINIQQSELKHQPAVNKKSAKIVESKKKQSQQSQEVINVHNVDQDEQDNQNEDKPVYERLHKIHYEKMQRQVQKAIEHTNQLTGKTSNNNDSKSQSRNLKKTKSEANFTSARDREIQSGKTVDELLYEDAKRRWEKQELKKKNLAKLKEEQIQSTKPPSGHNNAKFAAQKFEKEFYFLVHHIMNEMNNENQEDPNQDFNLREYDTKKINYVKLGQLMTELGYIPTNIAPDSVERELLFDMWNMLQGEENSGIQIINVKKFLLAVQGICIDAVERNHPLENHNSQNTLSNNNFSSNGKTTDDMNRPSQLLLNNFDTNGVLRLTQSETTKIFVKFKPLYVNRIQFQGQFKRVKQVENQCTFKPQISQTSEQLAIQRRIRILSETRQIENNGNDDNNNNNEQQQNNVTSVQDPSKVDIVQLLLHPVHTDKQWQQNAKFMLEQKELEECTFKPKITNYEGTNTTKSRILQQQQNNNYNSTMNDKCMELYMKAKPMREKRDKSRNDYEFEKAQDQCTFQPNITESQKNVDQLYFSQSNYQQYGADSQFLGSDGGGVLNQTTTQNIKGYQLMMARMQKGREDREKVKAMTTRGIPGTVTDESMLKPIQIEGNTNYKGAFSTFSHHPDHNIHINQQMNQTHGTQQQYNRSRLQNTKSIESLQSIVGSQSTKRQSFQLQQNQFSKTGYTAKGYQKQEKENIYHQHQQNPLSQSVVGNIFGGQDKLTQQQKPQYDNNIQKQFNRPASSQQSYQQQQQQYTAQNCRYNNPNNNNGRMSRFSDQQNYNPNDNDLSYDENEKKVLSGHGGHNNNNNHGSNNGTLSNAGNGFLNLPSDIDPDHSTASKTTTVKQPLLYVDVNLGPGKSERIVVYEGDTAEGLAEKFAINHSLDMNMKGKLAQLLDSQIAGLLEKIDEEQNSIHSDNI